MWGDAKENCLFHVSRFGPSGRNIGWRHAIIGMLKRVVIDEELLMNLHLPGVAWGLMGVISGLCVAGTPVPAQVKKAPTTAPYATAHDKPLEAVESVIEQADNHTKYRVEFNGIK